MKIKNISIRDKLFANFTRKWSKHSHKYLKQAIQCNRTITIDGNWKLYRSKCCYEHILIRSHEFGKIITGCRNSPNINSYFCKKHQNCELVFNAGDNKKKCYNPQKIKLLRLRKFYLILTT